MQRNHGEILFLLSIHIRPNKQCHYSIFQLSYISNRFIKINYRPIMSSTSRFQKLHWFQKGTGPFFETVYDKKILKKLHVKIKQYTFFTQIFKADFIQFITQKSVTQLIFNDFAKLLIKMRNITPVMKILKTHLVHIKITTKFQYLVLKLEQQIDGQTYGATTE